MDDNEIYGISIVIPTLNEEGNIKKLIERIVLAFSNTNYKYEIIVVDDNSSDRTQDEVGEIIANRTEQNNIFLYVKKGKRGKSISLIEGFSYAHYPILGMIDADLQYPPEAFPEMLDNLFSGYIYFIA